MKGDGEPVISTQINPADSVHASESVRNNHTGEFSGILGRSHLQLLDGRTGAERFPAAGGRLLSFPAIQRLKGI